ncbi:ABC transporter permease [Gordonia jinhuaensis]|uniref:ABC transporter permease n=1 Tax=Gordonia jinhuaensis TaxID=1517702 RepID=A0A916TFG2_9ACTN|nr:ABC transporter permease [Gordonia jinhuaensis]GGB43043.1 ABC transporter permease [Gordonia jinhuaensis]
MSRHDGEPRAGVEVGTAPDSQELSKRSLLAQLPGIPRRHPLAWMIAARLVGIVVVLFVISILTFALMHWAPGDLVRTLIGNRPVTPEVVAQVRAEYHLDDPILSQYWQWLTGALHGDFGTSVQLQEPVSTVLADRLPLTLGLVAIAFVIAVVTCIPLGIFAALRRETAGDTAATTVALIALSAPPFAVGLALLYVFAYYIPIFPVYGSGEGALDVLYHLILPAIALAAGVGAMLMRITRSAMIRELDSDYVLAARGRGLTHRQVIAVALRNAAIPIVTSGGLVLTFLISGTIVVETIFSLPGIGQILQNAVQYKDLPMLQGVTLVIAAAIAVIALLSDLIYLALDPRVRSGRTSR